MTARGSRDNLLALLFRAVHQLKEIFINAVQVSPLVKGEASLSPQVLLSCQHLICTLCAALRPPVGLVHLPLASIPPSASYAQPLPAVLHHVGDPNTTVNDGVCLLAPCAPLKPWLAVLQLHAFSGGGGC